MYIGADDDGNVVGIENVKEMLEIIPNKITDTMGIIADVNLLYEGELEYLQIVVDKSYRSADRVGRVRYFSRVILIEQDQKL